MHRFFVKEKNIRDGRVRISGGDFKHLSYSLRLDRENKLLFYRSPVPGNVNMWLNWSLLRRILPGERL